MTSSEQVVCGPVVLFPKHKIISRFWSKLIKSGETLTVILWAQCYRTVYFSFIKHSFNNYCDRLKELFVNESKKLEIKYLYLFAIPLWVQDCSL